MSNRNWFLVFWLLPVVVMFCLLIAGASTESQASLRSAQGSIIYLPNLPDDCGQVLSMVSARTGISVSYITKEGCPRMAMYTYTSDSSGKYTYECTYFRFENER